MCGVKPGAEGAGMCRPSVLAEPLSSRDCWRQLRDALAGIPSEMGDTRSYQQEGSLLE